MINKLKNIIHELPDFLYRNYYENQVSEKDKECYWDEIEDYQSEGTITSYTEWFELCYNQDFQQQVNMVVSVSLELYRVMVSSLLVVFIPQKCGDHVCALFENIHNNGDE